MNGIVDFLRAALPWVAIGLMVAVAAAVRRAKEEDKAGNKMARLLPWAPFACFLLVAALDFADGNGNRAALWLVLGICNVALNYVNRKKAS